MSGGAPRAATAVVALGRAAHFVPTVAVTAVVTGFAWIVGWHGAGLAGVALAVLIGQCSVGWCNDAHDAVLDRAAGRSAKPTVARAIDARTLWAMALIALPVAAVLSWIVAGWIGGSFHVLALASAWAYNLRLSRTSWSWFPYAIAFGCIPPFLSFGLDGTAPPLWLPIAFAITAVSAHLANALPDIESDRAVGRGGLATRLGARRTTIACWVLLAVGTGIVAISAATTIPVLAAFLVVAFIAVGAVARLRRLAPFHPLLAIVLLDVAAIIVATWLA